MAATMKCLLSGLVAVAVVGLATADAKAQCATCATPTVAYYQPAQPVAYQTYYRSGWYPGYWLDRANYAVWGRPRVVAAYPTYAAYRPAYTVGYAPATYAAYGSGCSTCASYAPACSSCSSCSSSPCSSCDTCTTCARPVTLTSQVVLRPVCGSACSSCGPACSSCSSCDSCSSCGTAATVMPVAYSAPAAAPCTNCGIPNQVAAPAGPAPNSYIQQPQPSLAPGDNPPSERTFLKEPANGSIEPTPSAEGSEESNENSATYMEAPQLFNPSDRTAQRVAAPVWNAVYHKTASGDGQQQLAADAAGWTSVSN